MWYLYCLYINQWFLKIETWTAHIIKLGSHVSLLGSLECVKQRIKRERDRQTQLALTGTVRGVTSFLPGAGINLISLFCIHWLRWLGESLLLSDEVGILSLLWEWAHSSYPDFPQLLSWNRCSREWGGAFPYCPSRGEVYIPCMVSTGATRRPFFDTATLSDKLDRGSSYHLDRKGVLCFCCYK